MNYICLDLRSSVLPHARAHVLADADHSLSRRINSLRNTNACGASDCIEAVGRHHIQAVNRDHEWDLQLTADQLRRLAAWQYSMGMDQVDSAFAMECHNSWQKRVEKKAAG